MVALENELISTLANTADVDGHDMGSGEMNVFIFCDDPEVVLKVSRDTLARYPGLDLAGAAFRRVDGEDYVRLWPVGSQLPFVVA